MVNVKVEITKEQFEKAQKDGANSLISDYIKMGYGVYGSRVREEDGMYFLEYERGDSCD